LKNGIFHQFVLGAKCGV